MAGAERFHRCLLCRKPRRKRRREITFPAAVRDLFVGKHTLHEPIAITLDSAGNACDLSGIEARAYNFHPTPSYDIGSTSRTVRVGTVGLRARAEVPAARIGGPEPVHDEGSSANRA